MHIAIDQSRAFDQAAIQQGWQWAQRTYCRLRTWQRPVPSEWPGTLHDAEQLVREFAEALDPVAQRRLAGIVQASAEWFWSELDDRRPLGRRPRQSYPRAE